MDPNTEDTQTQRVKCPGVTAQGKPCTWSVSAGQTYCHRHDPALVEERRRVAAQAGQGKSKDRRAVKALARVTNLEVPLADSLPSVRSLVHRSITDVLAGKIDPTIATAVASLAKTYQILDAAVKDEELAKELAELRQQMAEERGAA